MDERRPLLLEAINRLYEGQTGIEGKGQARAASVNGRGPVSGCAFALAQSRLSARGPAIPRC